MVLLDSKLVLFLWTRASAKDQFRASYRQCSYIRDLTIVCYIEQLRALSTYHSCGFSFSHTIFSWTQCDQGFLGSQIRWFHLFGPAYLIGLLINSCSINGFRQYQLLRTPVSCRSVVVATGANSVYEFEFGANRSSVSRNLCGHMVRGVRLALNFGEKTSIIL